MYQGLPALEPVGDCLGLGRAGVGGMTERASSKDTGTHEDPWPLELDLSFAD